MYIITNARCLLDWHTYISILRAYDNLFTFFHSEKTYILHFWKHILLVCICVYAASSAQQHMRQMCFNSSQKKTITKPCFTLHVLNGGLCTHVRIISAHLCGPDVLRHCDMSRQEGKHYQWIWIIVPMSFYHHGGFFGHPCCCNAMVLNMVVPMFIASNVMPGFRWFRWYYL